MNKHTYLVLYVINSNFTPSKVQIEKILVFLNNFGITKLNYPKTSALKAHSANKGRPHNISKSIVNKLKKYDGNNITLILPKLGYIWRELFEFQDSPLYDKYLPAPNVVIFPQDVFDGQYFEYGTRFFILKQNIDILLEKDGPFGFLSTEIVKALDNFSKKFNDIFKEIEELLGSELKLDVIVL